MNRLFPRLMLAMLLISMLSLLVIPAVQLIATERVLRALPQDFREQVDARTTPTPPFQRPRRAAPDRAEALQEATRILGLLGDYRQAQREGVVLGVAGALLLSVAVSWLLARGVAHPIEAVSSATARLASGDLRARAVLGTARPPQEAQQLAQDFNLMADALEAAEEERRAMITDIAHELRAPLASLQLRLDALRDGLVPFEPEEAERLQRQVGLLSRLIADLRTLSLADAGRLSLHLRPVDLTPLVQDVAVSYRAKAETQGIRLELSASEALSAHADPDRLRQILYNLLDNALAATPAGGWVRLGLDRTDQAARLWIDDSGPGIPEEKLGYIFERFQRGERRDVQGQEGSGLGLAIVKALVTAQDGTVRAENTGAGARFTVTLPLAGDTSAAA